MAEIVDEDLENAFVKASDSVKSCIEKFSTDGLLNLYGLYKQATEGPNKTSKPNFWNQKAVKKWDAWTMQAAKTKEEAMAAYIQAVTDVNPNFLTEPSASWVVHSVLQNTETLKNDQDKDIFDFVRENSENLVRKALAAGDDVNAVDTEGLGLCHWAADRGHEGIVRQLLEAGADPNLRDSEKQTALHYAASCGHSEIVSILLGFGADPSMCDGDQKRPCDVAESPDIVQLLSNL